MNRARRRTELALLGLLLPLLLAAAERPQGLGDVREVRTWSYAGYTRVVIELDRTVRLRAEELVQLPADRAAGRPDRLYLYLPGIWVGRRFEAGLPVGDGLLEALR